MVVTKWQVMKMWPTGGRPWRAWAPAGTCALNVCYCKSFDNHADALAYVAGFLHAAA